MRTAQLVTKALLALSTLILTTACGDDATESGAGGATASSSVGSGAGGQGGEGNAGGSGGTGGEGGMGSMRVTAPCDTDSCNLVFSGVGFELNDGDTIEWGLQQQGQVGVVFNTSGTIENGAFSFTEDMLLSKGVSYFLNYYVDANGDGQCMSEDDPSWRIGLTNVQTHYEITVVPGDSMSNLGCSGLN